MRLKITFLLLLLITVFSVSFNSVIGKKETADFTLTDINGNLFSLFDCSSKIVLIDFFGTTCIPCVEEIPTLRNIYNDYPRDQLEIISVSPEDEDDLRKFATEQNMGWIVASDSDGQVSHEYGVQYIPTLFVINTENHAYKKHVGKTGGSTLRSDINSLLSESSDSDSNGDSNSNSGTVQPAPPYGLIAGIAVVVVFFLIVGIVVAGKKLQWSKPAKKRRSHKL